MDERPQQRGNDDNGPDVARRAQPAAEQKTAEQDFLADRRKNHDGQPQPEQPSARARRLIDVELKRRDQIAPEQPAQHIAGGARACAAGEQRQQPHLDRSRHREDQGDGGAVAAEIRQMPEALAVPPGQRQQRHHLPGQQRDSRQREGRSASPRLDRGGHGSAAASVASPCPLARVDNLARYGNRIDDPVVRRASRSLCDLAASLSGYFWLTGIFTAPEPTTLNLSLIHISEPTRLGMISYAVFCLKKKKTK